MQSSAMNCLFRVLKPGSTTEYAYDGQDRRTVVIEDGVMTRTLWSGSDEVGEYDAAGVLKRRFIPDGSGSMDARLATVNADRAVYWHHTDHQGSVVATSNAAGPSAQPDQLLTARGVRARGKRGRPRCAR